MSEITALAPKGVWQFFDLISSIPHISGHEAALAAKLAEVARSAGLAAEIDAYGNLKIVRPAAPGMEKLPTVILQGHLDMVPASAGKFDFLTTPVSPRIDGEWVRADGTTLGADDGIGVAHAMALLMDREFRCGKLVGLFTTDEEVGMTGAAHLDPAWLDGYCLFNMDSGEEGFCIGCAGGERQEFTFTPAWEAAPEGTPVRISLSGLPGGHSGECIHENRGNAIRFLAEFLDQLPGFAPDSLRGGIVDNAIPAAAEATGVSADSPEELQKTAEAFLLLLRKESPAAKNALLRVELLPEMPAQVWSAAFRSDLLSALALCPDGMMEYDHELDVTLTSSNLATIRTFRDRVTVRTTTRSMIDGQRDEVSAAIRAHFALFHASAEVGNVYPATPPKPGSPLLGIAAACARECGLSDRMYAIHGGLESGWFSAKNPDLAILSCGPDTREVHTPGERVSIGSVAKFDRMLRKLLPAIGG